MTSMMEEEKIETPVEATEVESVEEVSEVAAEVVTEGEVTA